MYKLLRTIDPSLFLFQSMKGSLMPRVQPRAKRPQLGASVTRIYHPNYLAELGNWKMYRLVGKGGEDFLEEYLIKRKQESTEDFIARKKITYIPAFAKTALTQIQGSIRQRLTEVSRLNGSKNYQVAVKGLPDGSGVDRNASSMNKFIGTKVLEELTMMGGVGIYIDAPATRTTLSTLQDDTYTVPYLYTFPVEGIRSWAYDKLNPTKLQKLLLSEFIEVLDPEFGLTIAFEERYRYYSLDGDGQVTCKFFNKDGLQVNLNHELSDVIYPIGLSRIPFVFAQLSSSLLADIARYQIALLNLGSTDMKYAYEGSTVFLVEQYDQASPDNYFKQTTEDETVDSALPVGTKDPKTRFLGIDRGMRIPTGVEFPKYVSPDMTPLETSMKKQETLKQQIQELVNQVLRSITSRASDSDTHAVNERREEDGLKVIGDELEHAETLIAEIWAEYEGTGNVAEVNYPKTYQFKTDQDRRTEALELGKLLYVVPSKKGQKEVSKRIAYTILNGDISDDGMAEIYKEIDEAKGTLADPLVIAKLVEESILSPETAAVQIGFPPGEAQNAEDARVRRAEQIAKVQTPTGNFNAGARGVKELAADPSAQAKAEKQTAKDAGNKVIKDGSTADTIQE